MIQPHQKGIHIESSSLAVAAHIVSDDPIIVLRVLMDISTQVSPSAAVVIKLPKRAIFQDLSM
jgi:hypothetical protein